MKLNAETLKIQPRTDGLASHARIARPEVTDEIPAADYWTIVAINLFYLAVINHEEFIAMMAFFAGGVGSAQFYAALRATFRQAAALPEAREQRVPEVEHRLRLLENELSHVNAELERVRDGQEFDRKLMTSAAASGGLPAGRTFDDRSRP